MKETVQVRLVTIVAEAVLEASILALLKELGVSGYTASDARGEGSRGRRTGEIPGDNVRIETIVSAPTASALLTEISARWFADYAIVAWISDVDVVRGAKFRCRASRDSGPTRDRGPAPRPGAARTPVGDDVSSPRPAAARRRGRPRTRVSRRRWPPRR